MPDQAARTATVITCPELRTGDCCAEGPLVRDEPLGDATEGADGVAKFLRVRSRRRPRSGGAVVA